MNTPTWLKNVEWLQSHSIEEILMSNTAQLAADVAALTTAVTALTAVVPEAVSAITANDTPIDTSGIVAATTAISAATASLLAATQVATSISLNWNSNDQSVVNAATYQFEATVKDQSGLALATQPTGGVWSLEAGAGGTIDSSTGIYTAPASGSGTDTVTYTVDGLSGSTAVAY